jgi:DNA polymerase III epsilon subunit-like protein
MKNKSKQIKRSTKATPEKLKRLKALNERVRGSFKNFMTQGDLEKMRESKVPIEESPTLFEMNSEFIVFDLETTGRSWKEHEILQIAAIRISNGIIDEKARFHSYIKPKFGIPPFIQAYTGITPAKVQKAPTAREALRKFSKFAGEAVLIAHNCFSFDMLFIGGHCERHKLRTRPAAYSDSLHLSRRIWGTARGIGHKLDDVLIRLKKTPKDNRRHDARLDTLLLAHAVLGMATKLKLPLAAAIDRRKLGVLPHF